ncbi:schwannomin-interacting protein 1 homolog [Cylas formicarius]|uniref:schwannomin-interacting protein 1 homolog n=1 Tax=Cylas formicarius TaxID=197179 RepID=UPI0029586271|nr:schwannomin-interacting protein 1 homolog [Cylas formicarius]XP_060516874.1 schwannomin-interacting protein 1 homolog [Cylas formicarius]XP_060516875.1 schwannomin-interacting protein 1 homolog [Cylas formicarius]XP_060516876.1 schwannomin-interacting protein 1 homolog [Cylas formicarius]XP_060516877.1 schwannomin-interacting protein 1 homolog [Cylas formicarius]
MRLKSLDGPLAVHNGNNEALNSPKRINTLQNSNIISNYVNYDNNITTHLTTNNSSDVGTITSAHDQLSNDNVDALHRISNTESQKLRWCNFTVNTGQQNQQHQRQLALNNLANNRYSQIRNINNTLATQMRIRESSARCQELASPDDARLDDYGQLQSCSSSTAASPQDEDRSFDLSESGDSSDEGIDDTLAVDDHTPSLRCIVNPNYPGFQHLAHTLVDGYDEEALTNKLEADANHANNNDPDSEFKIDKFDSVNRLDSVENIQKVFHDKSLSDIKVNSESVENITCNSVSDSGATPSEEHCEVVNFNIKLEEKVLGIVVGDFRKEVEEELEKIGLNNEQFQETDNALVKAPAHDDTSLQLSTYIQSDQLSTEQSEADDKAPLLPIEIKMADAVLSDARELIPRLCENMENPDVNAKKFKTDTATYNGKTEQFNKEDVTKNRKEKDEDSTLLKDKGMSVPAGSTRRRLNYSQQFGSLISFTRKEPARKDAVARRSAPMAYGKKKTPKCETSGEFDVYNIETAMPHIDLEAIENHLRAAREEERRRRTDREEIRRRLAMGPEDEYYMDRPSRKPSLQARLQSGMNLQICFMNETVLDNDSPSSDSECPMTNPKQPKTSLVSQASPNANGFEASLPQRPATLSLQPQPSMATLQLGGAASETDFFTKQARLQTEARMALAQAKEMARMQMEIERQRQKKSPITEMVRHSLEKVGIPFPEEKRRLSRQLLTEMNVAQLQVIVNDLHTQIEILNEQLVKFLMDRDDLHMEQDSMLVDIEDLTRYLGAKEQVLKEQCISTPQNNNLPPPSPAPSSPLATINSTVKPHLHRIASLVKK